MTRKKLVAISSSNIAMEKNTIDAIRNEAKHTRGNS